MWSYIYYIYCCRVGGGGVMLIFKSKNQQPTSCGTVSHPNVIRKSRGTPVELVYLFYPHSSSANLPQMPRTTRSVSIRRAGVTALIFHRSLGLELYCSRRAVNVVKNVYAYGVVSRLEYSRVFTESRRGPN